MQEQCHEDVGFCARDTEDHHACEEELNGKADQHEPCPVVKYTREIVFHDPDPFQLCELTGSLNTERASVMVRLNRRICHSWKDG